MNDTTPHQLFALDHNKPYSDSPWWLGDYERQYPLGESLVAPWMLDDAICEAEDDDNDYSLPAIPE